MCCVMKGSLSFVRRLVLIAILNPIRHLLGEAGIVVTVLILVLDWRSGHRLHWGGVFVVGLVGAFDLDSADEACQFELRCEQARKKRGQGRKGETNLFLPEPGVLLTRPPLTLFNAPLPAREGV